MWKHIDLPIAYSVIWNKVVYHYFSYSQNSNFYMPSSVFEQRKNSKLYYETTKERVAVSEILRKLWKMPMLFWFRESVVENLHFVNIPG